MTTDDDVLKALDFPTRVDCVGARINKRKAGGLEPCPHEATKIITRTHANPEDPAVGKCVTNRYPVCDKHATVFRAAIYRQFYEDVTTRTCSRCQTTVDGPDDIIFTTPLFGKDTPKP